MSSWFSELLSLKGFIGFLNQKASKTFSIWYQSSISRVLSLQKNSETFLKTFLRAELSKEFEAQRKAKHRNGMESVKWNNCDHFSRASSLWAWSSAWSTPWSPPPPSVSCPGPSSSSPGTSTSPGWERPGECSEFLNTSRRCSERLELHPPLDLNM